MVNYYDEIKEKLLKNEIYAKVKDYSKERNKVLENQNENIMREVHVLEYKNNQLEKENTKLNDKIQRIIKAIKQFFGKLLQICAEYIKDYAEEEVKQYYDNKDFKMLDVKDIAKGTPREEEYEQDYDNYEEYDNEIDKDDFDLSL